MIHGIDDRPETSYNCLRCKQNPRPKRTNWDRIPDDYYVEVSTHHHLCTKCYNAERKAEHEQFIQYSINEMIATPSKKQIKRRVVHECWLDCGSVVSKGEYSWNVTVYGPRTLKVCNKCVDKHKIAANIKES